MMLDGVAVARAACLSGASSYDQIAHTMGLESGRVFEAAARDAWSGVERYVMANKCSEAMTSCYASGDSAGGKKWRKEMMKNQNAVIGDKVFEEAKKPVETVEVKKKRGRKPAVDKIKVSSKSVETAVRPVASGEVLCSAVSSLILGHAGREYMSRPVLLMRSGEVFGCPGSSRFGTRAVTLCNGLLNHCEMQDAPTPYWAVMDAMCELGTFTKDACISRAVERCGCDVKACKIAFDVLKGHHSHPRKREAGMSYIVDESDVRGRFVVRARSVDETVKYFESQRERRRDSVSGVDSSHGKTVTVIAGSTR